jgi:hypothetical protein
MRFILSFCMVITMLLIFQQSWSQEDSTYRQLLQQTREHRRSWFDDSVRRQLHERYTELVSRTNNYAAFTMTYERSSASLGDLNDDLAAMNLRRMGKHFNGFGIGFSKMKNRVTSDFLINFMLANTSSNNDHAVRLSGVSFSWDKGYAVVSKRAYKIFPFVGLSYDGYTIKVTDKNGAYPVNNLQDIGQGTNSGTLNRMRLAAYGGVEADYSIEFNKTSGLQIGFRYAYNVALSKGKYRFNNDVGSNYKPNIGWREQVYTVMIRFFGRSLF